MDEEKPIKKFFDSKLYYKLNKERINTYNRKYWKTYYEIYKLRKVYDRKTEKKIVIPYTGCTIKCNVRLTF